MLTTQKQVRAAFWEYVREVKRQGTNLHLTPKRITDYAGTGKMHNTDTRCTFVDWLDAEVKAGTIDPDVAERVTL